tara:strand:+ start:683 stop:2119 length:1437 start_codon:yes stop_codon:yes gene_type:complete
MDRKLILNVISGLILIGAIVFFVFFIIQYQKDNTKENSNELNNSLDDFKKDKSSEDSENKNTQILPIDILHPDFKPSLIKNERCPDETNTVNKTLKDYYMLGSYNSCSANPEMNDVSIESLKTVLKEGVRVIDIQIFSVDNVPIVSKTEVANMNEIYSRDSTTRLSVKEVLDTIKSYGFQSGGAQNYKDPLILNMRLVLPDNASPYDTIADNIREVFESDGYLLDQKYGFGGVSNDNHSKNSVVKMNINDLNRKLIIAVDSTLPTYKESKLYSLTNLSRDTPDFKYYIDSEILGNDREQLENDSKIKLIMVYPNDSNTSPDVATHKEIGAQISLLHFGFLGTDSNGDITRGELTRHFNRGSAFVLKDASKRHIPQFTCSPNQEEIKLFSKMAGISDTERINIDKCLQTEKSYWNGEECVSCLDRGYGNRKCDNKIKISKCFWQHSDTPYSYWDGEKCNTCKDKDGCADQVKDNLKDYL